jgi:chromosome segregation ATPase
VSIQALGDSSAAFDTYRKEIEQTRKELAKLTKERATWQTRHAKANAALIVAHQEKAGMEEALRAATAKATALEGLCRALRSSSGAAQAAGPESGAAQAPDAATTDDAAAAASAEKGTETPQATPSQ